MREKPRYLLLVQMLRRRRQLHREAKPRSNLGMDVVDLATRKRTNACRDDSDIEVAETLRTIRAFHGFLRGLTMSNEWIYSNFYLKII